MSGCFLISHSLWQNDVTKIGEKLVVMTELRFDTAEQRCFHYYTLSRSTLCIQLGMTRVCKALCFNKTKTRPEEHIAIHLPLDKTEKIKWFCVG